MVLIETNLIEHNFDDYGTVLEQIAQRLCNETDEQVPLFLVAIYND